MPIYEYRCEKCGHQESFIESVGATRVKKCPQCGQRAFSRLISAAAFHLKGGGWYATDFKDKPKAKAKEDAKDAKETKESGDKDGKDAKGGKDEKGKTAAKTPAAKKSAKAKKD